MRPPRGCKELGRKAAATTRATSAARTTYHPLATKPAPGPVSLGPCRLVLLRTVAPKKPARSSAVPPTKSEAPAAAQPLHWIPWQQVSRLPARAAGWR